MISVLCIILLVLYWIQNLTHANWAWLGFIKPLLDGLLDVANSIYSVSFNIFGAVFELKYLSAVIILVLISLVLKLLSFFVSMLQGVYESARFVCKKTEEAIFNKQLQAGQKWQQKKLTKYTVAIHTRLNVRYAYQESKINIDELNMQMNKFLTDALNTKPSVYQGGYVYNLDNFENIDTVLDALFKVINSQAPLSYAICIQIGDNQEQLNKLIELKNYGKITMASDTAYRYGFNTNKRYNVVQAGIFQCENRTIELHEFNEAL